MKSDHKTDFEKFLDHTDEKKVLSAEIISQLLKEKCKEKIDHAVANPILDSHIVALEEEAGNLSEHPMSRNKLAMNGWLYCFVHKR